MSDIETNEGARITLSEQLPQRLKLKIGDHIYSELSAQEVQSCSGEGVDFTKLIGIATLGEEWDGMSAVEVVDAIRGEPIERAALQSAVPHPNVKVLSRK